MDGSFDERRKELELECSLADGLFEPVRGRIQTFMSPFLLSFRRDDQKTYAEYVVSGLCSDLEDKNAESIAYLFELDRKPIQHFVGESQWEDRPLRDELARQVAATLGGSEWSSRL